ncbi:MAG TPA: CRTAC1 family protein [Thermoanaerobaculia bacterium]|nr:CRTAC1 family protein [Thermoanaerobaculia bacterium]
MKRARLFVAAILVAGSGRALAGPLTFSDATKAAGIRFKFRTDLRRGRMIATMGGGVAAADFDGDGWTDLFFTGSAGNANKPRSGPCGVLYRNRGDGTFEDVTERSGIRACGWQMGAHWIDVDSDGLPDLVVAGLDCTRVWRNLGGGKFRDVTRELGIDVGRQFTIGVAAGDIDGDGRTDLYFLGYLETTPEKERSFPQFQIRLPEDYAGETGIVFRQREDGRFENVTARTGGDDAGGKGTGAVLFDYDGDGKPDLFVANDRVSNRLYRNRGDGTFEDVTDETGAGARGGKPRAGMGIAVGDPFGSGRPDLYVTNFSGETNTYYRNVEGALFDDATDQTGTGRQSWPYVQWGTHFADFDDDGRPDLYAVSGHLVPHVLAKIAAFFNGRHLADMFQGDQSYREPISLWRNDGAKFVDAAAGSGDLGRTKICARGSSVADFDGDGRLDLAVAAISGGPRLFRNSTPATGHAIEILPAAADRRTALGTKVRVTAAGRAQTQEFILQPSYASGSWVPLHFGLGASDRADTIEVIPPGETQPRWTLRGVAGDRVYRLRAGVLDEVRAFRR